MDRILWYVALLQGPCRYKWHLSDFHRKAYDTPLICEFHQLIPTRINVLTGSSNVIIYIYYIWRKFFLNTFSVFSLNEFWLKIAQLIHILIKSCKRKLSRTRVWQNMTKSASRLQTITSKVRRAPRKTETCSPSGSWVEPTSLQGWKVRLTLVFTVWGDLTKYISKQVECGATSMTSHFEFNKILLTYRSFLTS